MGTLAHAIDSTAPPASPCDCRARFVGVRGRCQFCGGQLPEPDAIDRAILAHEAARNLRLMRESIA